MPQQVTSEKHIVAAESGRLDRVLAAQAAEHSRSRHKALILAGHVAVDGVTIRDPSQRVNAGSAITLAVPPAIDDTAAVPVGANGNGHRVDVELMEVLALKVPPSVKRAIEERAEKEGRPAGAIALELLEGDKN